MHTCIVAYGWTRCWSEGITLACAVLPLPQVLAQIINWRPFPPRRRVLDIPDVDAGSRNSYTHDDKATRQNPFLNWGRHKVSGVKLSLNTALATTAVSLFEANQWRRTQYILSLADEGSLGQAPPSDSWIIKIKEPIKKKVNRMPPMMNFQGLLLEKSRVRLRWLCTPKAAAASDNNSWKIRLNNGFLAFSGSVSVGLLDALMWRLLSVLLLYFIALGRCCFALHLSVG